MRIGRSCGLAGIAAGSDAHDSAEVPREVALVGKARSQRQLRKRPAHPQHFFGAVDSDLRLVGVRRHARFLTKDTMQVERTQMSDASQMTQRNGIGKMLVYESTDLSHRVSFAASVYLARGGCGTSSDQQPN